ncbi:MAG: 16S rRNA (guanine(527)-N(7))-methyltransferase RsmG [Pseudomonadota bacterium]
MTILKDVSRETIERLELFEALTCKWTNKINLVAASTLDDFWRRHVIDSAQIWPLRPSKASTWVDIGSGGGAPGIIIAAIAAELEPELKVTLVESDTRKCVFLRQAAREMEISLSVENKRVEMLDGVDANILSARALAPISDILRFSQQLTDMSTVFILPKGKTARHELDAARESWSFEHSTRNSETNPEAVIIKLWNVASRK